MKKRFRQITSSTVFRNFLLYSAGALLLRGVGFFLIPVYTRYLIPSEYGKLELLNTFTSTIEILFSFGLYQVVVMEFFKKDDLGKKELIDRVVSAYLAITTVLYIFTAAVITVFKKQFDLDITNALVMLALLTSYFNFYQNCFIVVLRLNERAKFLTALQVSIGILSILLNLLLVVVVKAGITGIICSNLITLVISNLLAVTAYRRQYGKFKGYFSLDDFKSILRLGFLFVPGFIAFWLMNSVSRWMLASYCGLTTVGIYSVAVKFSSMIDPLLVQPFLGAYNPRTLKGFSEGNFNQHLSRYIPVIILLFVILGVVLKWVAVMMVDPAYLQGADFIPVLVMAVSFGLIANVSNLILIYRRKIHLGLISVLAGLTISALANYFLVGKYGGLGAAYGTVLGNLCWMLMLIVFHRREMKSINADEHFNTQAN